MTNQWKHLGVVFGAVLVGSMITTIMMSPNRWMIDRAGAQDPSLQHQTDAVDQQNLAHAESLSNAFRNVAALVRPSVVSISTRQVLDQRAGVPPHLQDLFGGGPQERSGMGSGVIVRSDGYILTNNHVVEDSDELMVELYDGRIVPAKIVGTDPPTDLAVIKIDATGLRPAKFGDTENVRVGDWVVAIGSPFGLNQTVTAGIISGKNRVQGIVDDGAGFESFLQTDAAINPGNSGGALVNLRGQVIGINTAILSRSGASAGIGFAIPSSIAMPVLDSIVQYGEVRRGFLGATVDDVTPETTRKYRLKANRGALITGVLADNPADKAGLKEGDVVTKMDGRPVQSGNQLRNYIASRPPGSTVKMEVNRNGQVIPMQVNLQERTDEALAMFGAGGFFGADLVPATPQTARQYGYDNLRGGLIVSAIRDGSQAADAGLQVGDVLESASGVPLASVKQLAQIADEFKRTRRTMRLIVRRGDQRSILPLVIQ